MIDRYCKTARLSGFKPVPPDEDFDQGQLVRGTDLEMEHTTNREVAKIIAKHHLMEHPFYYHMLEHMEKALNEIERDVW